MVINSDFDITVLSIHSANRLWNAASDTLIHRKCRKRWAVALKRTGKTIYTVNGRQYISDSLHPVILPGGSSYSWQCVEAGECLIIEFDALQESREILSFSVTDSGFFIHDFLKIETSLHTETPEARLESRYRLSRILLTLIKTRAKDYAPREKQRLLAPAIEHLGENYYDPEITNDRLAKLCGISTVYFRKCFETVYGVSPIRYLHNYRTQKAKDLLSSDYGSIGQVAQSVGYSSVYHFSKMFKTYTGLSPSQYVKSVRK